MCYFLNGIMVIRNACFHIFCMVLIDALVVNQNKDNLNTTIIELVNDPENVFNGVYTECFIRLSYTCLQSKTLLYIKELNNLSEISIVGDFVKFVKINTTGQLGDVINQDGSSTNTSEQLELMIDKAINSFFSNHVLKFSGLGSDISLSKNVEEFVGRKKRKGGGGGGDQGDHDGGKKKMMMMAMMCMKMKLMIMVPAMMGMMGMMSFKGMMFSMMSFMISKMMLLMKILEKKGVGSGFGGGAGGGNDGVWAATGGGGGAWMPAGGQDYAGGGGYDSNAQWQSRSIFEMDDKEKPIISYVTPIVKYSKGFNKNRVLTIGYQNELVNNNRNTIAPKSRKKRDIIDVIQNTYSYWINKLFGLTHKRRSNANLIAKYKMVNGVKYVFHPFRTLQKLKLVKDAKGSRNKPTDEEFKPIITAADYNKGEIFEGGVESRMNRAKFHKMKDTVNDTMDDNPWE